MKAVNLKDVTFSQGFWADYRKLVREVVIPYQWEALNDNIPGAEPSHAIENFKIAAGLAEGEFGGMVFQDSDLAKWLEAVGYSLASQPDPEWEKKADEIISYIEKAQQPDGYLNTYYILNGLDKRFTNLLDCHEMYCLGHMIEGAVAYYDATGKKTLLDAVSRYADLVDSLFGPEEGKSKGYPGHQEIELALVKLSEATGNERYAKLAEFFINQRGQSPSFFEEEWEKRGRTRFWEFFGSETLNLPYNQAHIPVRDQDKAIGHAVRATYMYAGMADVAKRSGDPTLLNACKNLWDNITTRQIYITGGIGQTAHGEAFTFDYDLPNDTVYNETCAAIALVFFAQRMLTIEADSKYSDIMETALYNGVISGMERDGKRFFYVNPLEVWPEASEKAPLKRHVKPERQKWFGCSCCPPNLARLVMSLGKYIYTYDENTIYTHLYAGGTAQFDIGGNVVSVTQQTDYPVSPSVTLQIAGGGQTFTMALRIPGWCRGAEITVDGEKIACQTDKGYVYITREWGTDSVIELVLPMPVEIMRAHTHVRADAGKVAIQRGPLVYCLEEKDNGSNLSALRLLTTESLTEKFDAGFFGGAMLLHSKGERERSDSCALYSTAPKKKENADLTFVPYYLWGNRGIGEMAVWIRE